MRWRGEKGQSVVEAALVVPLLLLLLAGLVDTGMAFRDEIGLTNATREGARYGSRYPWETGNILSATQQEVDNLKLLPADAAKVTIASPSCYNPAGALINCVDAGSGDTIMVTLTYRRRMPFLGAVIPPGSVTLRAGTTMVVFGDRTGPTGP
jgi:Flp pilus assembly protein TadG